MERGESPVNTFEFFVGGIAYGRGETRGRQGGASEERNSRSLPSHSELREFAQEQKEKLLKKRKKKKRSA